jgi:hypothetical protein
LLLLLVVLRKLLLWCWWQRREHGSASVWADMRFVTKPQPSAAAGTKYCVEGSRGCCDVGVCCRMHMQMHP